MSSDLKTESLAKKLAQSNNQKCNFKYLMNSKTKRSCKNNQPSKQNEIESVIINSAHKLANKALKTYSYDSQIIDSTRLPLSLQSASLTNREETQASLRFYKQQKMKTYDSEEFQIYSKLKTEIFEISSSSVACMTDDCYHEKELLIKIDLLKKQRDEIWNSISDIVKQNLSLKEIVANFTINSKSMQTAHVQTQAHQLNQIEIQTDLEGSHLDEQYQTYLQSKKELEEAQSFCLKIIKKEQQQECSNSASLKDLFIESLNINLMKLTSEFQKQKEFLMSMNNQKIQQWQQMAEKLKNEIEHSNLKFQESKKSRENIKKIYQREIQELKSLVENKEISFINQIVQIKQDWQYVIQNGEMKHKFYLDYFENTKYCFKEKQAMYSTLLSQSHKTISNLMNQVKQFQVMANSNYRKHLKSQKSKHSAGNVLKALE